jgi:hypothetical protein
MPRLTIHDQIVRGLQRLGYELSAAQPAKFVAFDAPGYPEHKIYVGRLGAVRSGARLRDSVPLDGLKVRAMTAGLPEVWP